MHKRARAHTHTCACTHIHAPSRLSERARTHTCLLPFILSPHSCTRSLSSSPLLPFSHSRAVCGCVSVWVCGYVGMWVCGCLGVWVCVCECVCVCVCVGVCVCVCVCVQVICSAKASGSPQVGSYTAGSHTRAIALMPHVPLHTPSLASSSMAIAPSPHRRHHHHTYYTLQVCVPKSSELAWYHVGNQTQTNLEACAAPRPNASECGGRACRLNPQLQIAQCHVARSNYSLAAAAQYQARCEGGVNAGRLCSSHYECFDGGGFCRDYCPEYRHGTSTTKFWWAASPKCWMCPEAFTSGLTNPEAARDDWQRLPTSLCEECLGYFARCSCGLQSCMTKWTQVPFW